MSLLTLLQRRAVKIVWQRADRHKARLRGTPLRGILGPFAVRMEWELKAGT